MKRSIAEVGVKNFVNLNRKKNVKRAIPVRYVMKAINLINGLLNRNFIIFVKNLKIYFKDDVERYKNSMKVDMGIVLRSIFIKNASIVK